MYFYIYLKKWYGRFIAKNAYKYKRVSKIFVERFHRGAPLLINIDYLSNVLVRYRTLQHYTRAIKIIYFYGKHQALQNFLLRL